MWVESFVCGPVAVIVVLFARNVDPETSYLQLLWSQNRVCLRAGVKHIVGRYSYHL